MKQTERKSRRNLPAVLGIALAVVLFAGVILALILRPQKEEEEPFTLPPMLFMEDRRYLFERDITEDASQLEAEFIYLGEIRESLSETEYVYENFQTNFPAVGEKLYRWEEYVVLYHGEKIWLMRPMAEIQTETFVQS
jgi:hypothetical protein